ncbi:hypothetical protein VitviT2T_030793 [Vitis vinifera]|uniref:Uncharacterized protein n=1 Tax=Vitis vinifera TaxID=29760 RepID=A0ABY9E4U4_VITVI|nr:hypothetical protein VitviT2T_030793 [Vitis vinifera]
MLLTVLVEKSIPEFAPGETVNKKGKEIVDGKKGKEVDENLTLEEAIQTAQKIEKKVAGLATFIEDESSLRSDYLSAEFNAFADTRRPTQILRRLTNRSILQKQGSIHGKVLAQAFGFPIVPPEGGNFLPCTNPTFHWMIATLCQGLTVLQQLLGLKNILVMEKEDIPLPMIKEMDDKEKRGDVENVEKEKDKEEDEEESYD